MGMRHSVIVVAVISVALIGFAPMLAFGETNYHDLVAIKSVEKIPGDVSDFAIVQVRMYNSEMSTINVNPDLIHVKNAANEFFPLALENNAALDSDCLTSGTTVSKGLSKLLILCFEVPKDPNEDYILVIDKDKTILDSPLDYFLYLSSHNISLDYDVFDVSSVYFTIHDVKKTPIGGKKILVVQLTAYNGHSIFNKYGDDTQTSLPITGKNIFVADSEGKNYRIVPTGYVNTGYEEFCPRLGDVRTNQYRDITLCFDVTAPPIIDRKYWLVFNESPTVFTCPTSQCQEKRWALSSFLETIETQNPIEPSPMETSEKNNQMTSPQAEKIPSWVKDTFSWYVDGLISEDEVISAIQFLVKQGIIKI